MMDFTLYLLGAVAVMTFSYHADSGCGSSRTWGEALALTTLVIAWPLWVAPIVVLIGIVLGFLTLEYTCDLIGRKWDEWRKTAADRKDADDTQELRVEDEENPTITVVGKADAHTSSYVIDHKHARIEPTPTDPSVF